VDALFELGLTYSTGRSGIPVDLVEAHKWFNLAALARPAARNAAPRSQSK
jgi:TPR repeat protein